MSVNLLDIAKTAITSQLTGKLGGLLGEDDSKAQSAVASAIPAILGGLMNKASTPEGASALSKQLDDDDHSGLLDNIGAALGGGKHQGLINVGLNLLKGLLGPKLAGVVDLIASASGISKQSSNNLLGMLAPMVMGMLGKQKKEMGLDAGGLGKLLMGQKDFIGDALPKGMGDALGIGSLLGGGGIGDTIKSGLTAAGDAAEDAADAVGDATDAAGRAVGRVADKTVEGAKDLARGAADAAGDAADAVADGARDMARGAADVAEDVADGTRAAAAGGASLLQKLLPLLILAGLILLGLFLFSRGCKKDPADSNGANITVPSITADNAEDQVKQAFADLNKGLGSVTDTASATAAVGGIQGATKRIGAVSAALSKLPGPVQGIVKGLIAQKVPELKATIDKVLAIPGVGAILKKYIDPLLRELDALA